MHLLPSHIENGEICKSLNFLSFKQFRLCSLALVVLFFVCMFLSHDLQFVYVVFYAVL